MDAERPGSTRAGLDDFPPSDWRAITIRRLTSAGYQCILDGTGSFDWTLDRSGMDRGSLSRDTFRQLTKRRALVRLFVSSRTLWLRHRKFRPQDALFSLFGVGLCFLSEQIQSIR
jgi:hypothetical protein